MKTYCIPNLTEQDLQWIDKKLRADFDSFPEVWQYREAQEVIVQAERMGRRKLAEEMRSDLGMKPNRMLSRAGILNQSPSEINLNLKVLG